MPRRLGFATAIVAGLLVLGGACGGDGDEPDGPPGPVTDDVPTGGAGATTTSGTEVSADLALPPTIDAAYVDRVLAELDRVQGDVFRRIVSTGAFSPSELVPLRAVFHDPELRAQAEGFAGLVGSIDRARNPPGDNRTTVVRLLTARPDCIYAETTVDLSATVVEPPPPRPTWVALRPSSPGRDPQNLNPTPFSIAAEHDREANPCG